MLQRDLKYVLTSQPRSGIESVGYEHGSSPHTHEIAGVWADTQTCDTSNAEKTRGTPFGVGG